VARMPASMQPATVVSPVLLIRVPASGSREKPVFETLRSFRDARRPPPAF